MTDSPNAAQIADWNSTVGEGWARTYEMRDRFHANLTRAVLEFASPRPGERVLDIGCGCGGTTLLLADRVAPQGLVTGVDISAPMLAVAERRAAEEHLRARFIQADASVHDFVPESFDLAFSQFGVMFFANPAAAFANIRRALKRQGRLVFICWRGPSENPWSGVPEETAKPFLPPAKPAAPDAPGRYSFADPERVRGILTEAKFRNVEMRKFDASVDLGRSAEQAALDSIEAGPLARTLLGADEETRAKVRAAMEKRLAKELGPEGIFLMAACWLVRAAP